MASPYVELVTERLAEHMLTLPLSMEEKCCYAHYIFCWADLFDAGHIELHSLDALTDCGYFYLFPLEEHPYYQNYQAVLTLAARENFACINVHPKETWDRTANPIACYWIGAHYGNLPPINKLCCSPRHSLWPLLTGRAVPQPRPSLDIVIELAALAHEYEALGLKADLYHAAIPILAGMGKGEKRQALEQLKKYLWQPSVMATIYEDYLYYETQIVLHDESEWEESPCIRDWLSYYTHWKQSQPSRL